MTAAERRFPAASDHAGAPVRIGDKERADAAERLSAHAGAGRLTVEELEQRLEHVQAAVFLHDLRSVEADLPEPYRRGAATRRPPLMAIAIACLAAAVAATVAIGHPIVPLVIAAALLWRATHRTRLITQRSAS
jgi:hypothetical protein